MSKKLLSVFVALMMVVSMFAIVANAAGYEDDETAAEYTQDWALSEPVDNGDGTWTVDVLLTTNYGTGPIQFVLTNTDTSVAAIKSVTLGDAIPESYNATVSVSKAKGKVMIIADTTNTGTITAEEIDGVIATVVYTYAGEGSAEIAIDDNAKSATNVAGTLIAARMSDGDLVTGNPITGQTVTVGDSVIIGSAAGEAPTLAVIDGTIGVIDTTRTEYGEDWGDGYSTCTGYIFGVEPEYSETVDAVFEVVGDGELQIVANEAGSEAGTGTIVNVLDEEGNVVESYVYIYFGDMDGDGAVGLSDAAMAEDYEMLFEGIETLDTFMAGDLDADSMPGLSDSGTMFDWEMLAEGMPYQGDVAANVYGNIIYEIF